MNEEDVSVEYDDIERETEASQRIVDIIEFNGQFLVATEGGVYRMEKDEDGNDVFKPILFAGVQNDDT